jgi:hypothetical protein
MSDTEMNVDPPAAEEEPRRSSRKRKQPENFIAESTRQGGKSGNKQQDKEKADGGSGDEEEEEDDEEEDDESEEEPAAQQPKRRKTAPTTEGNPVKRGRGRPPKAKPADPPAETPAKRGRGRPKSTMTATAAKPAKKTVPADATGGSVRDDNGLFSASSLLAFSRLLMTACARRPRPAGSRVGAVHRGLGRRLPILARRVREGARPGTHRVLLPRECLSQRSDKVLMCAM